MTKRPDTFIPLMIGDYLKDTGHLTTEQHGAYLLLLMAYWARGGALIADDARLAATARLTTQKWLENRAIISEFFEERNGFWYNKRSEEEIKAAKIKMEAKTRAGATAANARWQSHSDRITSEMRSHSQRNAKSITEQCPSPLPLPSPSPSPLSNNKEEISLLSAKADDDAIFPDFSDVVEIYNSEANRHGWPKVQRLTVKRAKALRGRLRECGGVEGWREAMRKAGASAFLTGKTPQNYKAHFDFFLQESSFTKLMEGKYDGTSGQSGGVDAAFERLAERHGRETE